jgi:hypothetical protein
MRLTLGLLLLGQNAAPISIASIISCLIASKVHQPHKMVLRAPMYSDHLQRIWAPWEVLHTMSRRLETTSILHQ